MILDFSVGNYRSFNSIQTLSFRATSLVSDDKEVDSNNIVYAEGGRLLKTIGLYGANGSGKSNLLKALGIFRRLVQISLISETIMEKAPDPFKLSDADYEEIGFFQIQLMLQNKKYRYGFSLKKPGIVSQEWLFGPAEHNETWYFKRTGQEIEVNKEWFQEGTDLPLQNLRANTLFLTFVSSYNGTIAQTIRKFIINRIKFDVSGNRIRTSLTMPTSIRGSSSSGATNSLIREGYKSLVLDMLKNAGLIYEDIYIEKIDDFRESVYLLKKMGNKNSDGQTLVEMDLDNNESAGTRKFFSLIGLLNNLFEKGGALVSDEIDNNFHPSLLRHFLKLFNDPNINKANAQLLFTSHDTNLMQPDILRRDQLYFSEKSRIEESILYSLADLKGIRNNADFARQYLAGYYGALPILETYKHD